MQDDSQNANSEPTDETEMPKTKDTQSINVLKTEKIALIANIWALIKIIWFIYLLFWGARMLCREHKEGRKIGW